MEVEVAHGAVLAVREISRDGSPAGDRDGAIDAFAVGSKLERLGVTVARDTGLKAALGSRSVRRAVPREGERLRRLRREIAVHVGRLAPRVVVRERLRADRDRRRTIFRRARPGDFFDLVRGAAVECTVRVVDERDAVTTDPGDAPVLVVSDRVLRAIGEGNPAKTSERVVDVTPSRPGLVDVRGRELVLHVKARRRRSRAVHHRHTRQSEAVDGEAGARLLLHIGMKLCHRPGLEAERRGRGALHERRRPRLACEKRCVVERRRRNSLAGDDEAIALSLRTADRFESIHNPSGVGPRRRGELLFRAGVKLDAFGAHVRRSIDERADRHRSRLVRRRVGVNVLLRWRHFT